MIEKNVKLWLGDGPLVTVRVSQFDTMWRFIFSIVNNSQPWEIPSGASAVLNGRKPDGNVFAFSGAIENNAVTVDADVQMTAVAGQTVCELSILADGKVVGTANFILDVEAAPKSPEDVSSESTLPAYGEILDRIEEMWGGGSGGSVTVDDALSGTSENPVQNKVIKAALDNKVDAVEGKVLSDNNYTNTEKLKLAGIAAGANKTTVDSALSTTSANPVQNKVVKRALDVKITAPPSPTAGQFLVYNGSAWVAQTVPSANGVSF